MITVNVPLSGKQMKVIFSHTFFFAIMLVVIGQISHIFYRGLEWTWILSALCFTAIIIISALDYLDILRFRKSVARLTKCSVCGRKYKHSEESIDSETEIETKVSGGKDTKKKTTRTSNKKEQFLNGIIVHDKLICQSCLKDSDELRKGFAS